MQTTTKLPVLFTSGSRRCLHLLSTQGCSSFVKYLNVLLSNLRYMAANKQTDIQTRLCNALTLVCGVLIQACLNDGLRMSSEWVGSQKPHQSHPKQQSFCLRREERRICFLSTQLPKSHPPPRPLPPSHIQLSTSFSYHPFSSSFPLSPTIFLFSLSLHIS